MTLYYGEQSYIDRFEREINYQTKKLREIQMELEYDEKIGEEEPEFVNVDVDLFLKDIISIKKPRRSIFDEGK